MAIVAAFALIWLVAGLLLDRALREQDDVDAHLGSR